MRFLVDMGVDVRVAEWLRSEGHDATHLRDQGLQRLPNGEIFQKAASEKRTVLTFDLDFGEIAALTRGERAGVIVLRLQNARYQHVIDRLSTVLKESAAALEKSAVISVQEGRHRIRYFPAAT
jgi:predicted nuclease of predicted toxin-antitoxin system